MIPFIFRATFESREYVVGIRGQILSQGPTNSTRNIDPHKEALKTILKNCTGLKSDNGDTLYF